MRGLRGILPVSILSFALSVTTSAAMSGDSQEPVRVAAAASLERVVVDLSKAFTDDKKVSVAATYAATGKLVAQIKEGAPVDVLMAADTEYPEELRKAGLAASAPQVFAKGPLALWTTRPAAEIDLAGGLTVLSTSGVKRIAIANPRVAPYGRAAEAALLKAGLLKALKAKFVFGESVAQVNHYVATGAADVGITANASIPAGVGTASELASDVAPPLPQGVVVTKRGGSRADGGASAFVAFVLSPAGQKILALHGYLAP